jgi:hypothetical protein
MQRHLVRAALVFACLISLGGTETQAIAQPFPTGMSMRSAAYRASISALPKELRHRMRGSSWHSGCPVGLDDLRLLGLTYWGFDKTAHHGKLVVHRRWARKIVVVFRKLYDARFPIRKMFLIDRYDAKDKRSMRADNTSAFNCRYRNGVCCVWSQHAFGRAIDINPVENPYVGDWGVSPPNGAPFVKRKPLRKGMLSRHDRAWWAFHGIGWEWGGQWTWPIDYQHFSANNR